MRNLKTLQDLRTGKTVNFDGIKMVSGEIEPGDLYVAERNTGPKLLTAEKIRKDKGYIVPVDFPAYSFDICECVKIEEAA